MKNQLFYFLALFNILASSAQTTINGTVTDKSGNAISGANVYLEGTYDGSSTSESGTFNFETSESGDQTLVISALAYETHYEMGDVSYFKNLKIELVEAVNQLNGVTLSAGTFEAGDNSKVSVLKTYLCKNKVAILFILVNIQIFDQIKEGEGRMVIVLNDPFNTFLNNRRSLIFRPK